MFNFSVRKGEVVIGTVLAQRLGRNLFNIHVDTISKYPCLDNSGVDEKGQPYFYFTADENTIKVCDRLRGQSTLVTVKLPGYRVLGHKYNKYGYDVIIKKESRTDPEFFQPKRVRC